MGSARYDGRRRVELQVITRGIFPGRLFEIEVSCSQSPTRIGRSPLVLTLTGVVSLCHMKLHGWSFDLFTGMADGGQYKLRVWGVQLRNVKGAGTSAYTGEGPARVETEEEVWVRRQQRIS